MKPESKYITSTMVGTFLEYFNYMLFAFLTPTLAPLFFPAQSSVASLLMAWGAFFICFIARPFGAVLFGHLGDRFGRQKALSLSLILMAVPTILMGFIPAYEEIGIMAPVLLIFCRLLQGFSISSEYNGGSIYLTEMAKHYKGFLASLIPCASGLGILAASLITLLSINMTIPVISTEGWRIAFIFTGIIAGGIGYYMRRSLPETPAFIQLQKRKGIVKIPFFTILQQGKLELLICIILSAYLGFASWTILVYMASYLKINLGFDTKIALALIAMTGLVEALFSPLFGFLSDIFRRRLVLSIAAMCMTVLSIPLFVLLQTDNIVLIAGVLIILAICLAAFDGPLSAFLPLRFSIYMRYSGLAIGFNIGAGVIGGSSPLLLTWLSSYNENHLLPGFFLAGLSFISVVTLWLLKDKVQ